MFMVLKNKIQLSKSEDLICFIQQYVNQEALHLASRKVLQGAVQNEDF